MHAGNWKPMSRRNLALLCGVLGAATVALVILLTSAGSSAKASTASPYAAYPALNSTESSGLPLVTSHQPYRPGESTGPTFPAEAPEGALTAGGRWPISSSIRRVTVGAPGVSVWIAKSFGGGVCVLVWDGISEGGAVDFSCSTSEDLDRGASVQVRGIPSMPGKELSAGVVPDSTTSVTTQAPNGSTEAMPITDNAWARFSEEGATTTQGG
jgi:hypothetical protein